jgi:hypothetical protein
LMEQAIEGHQDDVRILRDRLATMTRDTKVALMKATSLMMPPPEPAGCPWRAPETPAGRENRCGRSTQDGVEIGVCQVSEPSTLGWIGDGALNVCGQRGWHSVTRSKRQATEVAFEQMRGGR